MHWKSFFSAPLATTPSQCLLALLSSFFARPAELGTHVLIGCLLVKRLENCSLFCSVVVETKAYSQDDLACHGCRRCSPST